MLYLHYTIQCTIPTNYDASSDEPMTEVLIGIDKKLSPHLLLLDVSLMKVPECKSDDDFEQIAKRLSQSSGSADRREQGL